MQLSPREYFTVARQIEDPLDTATYYVRAEIRNARTDALIATLDLTDRGSRRFGKEWQVPADPSGRGFYITVVTKVYTDSGYTTVSEQYGEKLNEYLVQDRFNKATDTSWASTGADVDYKRIKKIVDEAVAKIDVPEGQTVDLSPLKRAFDEGMREIVKDVRAIKIPEPRIEKETVHTPVDLSPLEKRISNAVEEIKKSIPEREEHDMSPMMEAVNTLHDAISNGFGELKDAILESQIVSVGPREEEEEVKLTRGGKIAVRPVAQVNRFGRVIKR